MQNRLKISDPTKIVTLANIISLFRAVLAVPIVYTLRDPSLGSITLLLILILIFNIILIFCQNQVFVHHQILF